MHVSLRSRFPSLSSGCGPLAVRSTKEIFLLPRPGSSQCSTMVPCSTSSRFHRTRSVPLFSCTWPHIASLGRILHKALRRSSHPLSDVVRSPWYFKGVCVRTISAFRGMGPQMCFASSALYANAHMPSAGEYGEPNILNVVRGPVGHVRLITAASCLSHVTEGDLSKSS